MSYYEYKYMIEPHQLPLAISLLDSMYSASDPYPAGIVNSLYFDTKNNDFFQTCLEGNFHKNKYRLRWYDNQQKIQSQIKTKNLHQVTKVKHDMQNPELDIEFAKNNCWRDLFIGENAPTTFYHPASCQETLWPLIQISYHRRRYRAFDYRFTIDSNITAQAIPSHPSKISGYTTIPFSVLEIKTRQKQPFLPFMGRLQLSQTSMSKYALCIHMLIYSTDALNKYVAINSADI